VISRSAWFCPVAGLPWLSANTTSTLAPPRPASPAFFAKGEIAELGMGVVDDIHGDFERGLGMDARLEAARHALIGKMPPILTVACASAGPARNAEIEAGAKQPEDRLESHVDGSPNRCHAMPGASPGGERGITPATSVTYWLLSIACPVGMGKLRRAARDPSKGIRRAAELPRDLPAG